MVRSTLRMKRKSEKERKKRKKLVTYRHILEFCLSFQQILVHRHKLVNQLNPIHTLRDLHSTTGHTDLEERKWEDVWEREKWIREKEREREMKEKNWKKGGVQEGNKNEDKVQRLRLWWDWITFGTRTLLVLSSLQPNAVTKERL